MSVIRNLLLITGLFTTVQLSATEIHLLHYNDFHTHNLPEFRQDAQGGFNLGGAALLKSAVDSLRLTFKHTLLIHAGDDFQGSPISSITRGASQVEVMNGMGVDVFTPGNHEYDYGDIHLMAILQGLNADVINCNLTDSTGALHFPAWKAITIDGVRLAFIGVMSNDLPTLVIKDNLQNTVVLEPVEAVRKALQEVQPGSDLQIVVSHMGFYADSLLAVALPEIDLIIGGHSHTTLTQPVRVGSTCIVQAGCCGHWLGDVQIDDHAEPGQWRISGTLIPVDSRHFSPAGDMVQLVDDLLQQLPPELNEVVGHLQSPWVRTHTGASNVGNWTCDVVRDYAEADLCFINNGSFRKDIPAGPVTRLDIMELHPFGNHFVVFDMQGMELFQFLTRQVRGDRENFAFSGLELTVNRSLHRISGIRIGDDDLVMNRTYRVVINNYSFSHLESFFGITPEGRNVQHLPGLDRDIVVQALQQAGPVNALLDGRLRFE